MCDLKAHVWLVAKARNWKPAIGIFGYDGRVGQIDLMDLGKSGLFHVMARTLVNSGLSSIIVVCDRVSAAVAKDWTKVQRTQNLQASSYSTSSSASYGD